MRNNIFNNRFNEAIVIKFLNILFLISLVATFYTGTNSIRANAAVSPLDISDLTLWLDGTDLDGDGTSEGLSESGLTGSEVDVWVDKSGVSNSVTSPTVNNRPLLTTNVQNGLPVLDFSNNVNSYLAAPDDDQITANGSYTKIAVFDYSSADSNNNIISSEDGGTLLWGGSVTGGTSGEMFVRNENPASNFLSNGYKLNLNEFYIVATVYDNVSGDSQQSILNLNGQTVAIDDGVHPHLAARTTIGAHNNGAGGLDGNIGEAMIFDRALDNRELSTLECYLSEKWGITVSTNCNKVYLEKSQVGLSENGGTDVLPIRLNESITSNVVIDLTVADTNEATISPTQLTFTPTGGSNPWDVVQNVTVTGVNDNNTTIDQTTITVSVNSSSDANYTSQPDQLVDVVLYDDDIVDDFPTTINDLTLWLDGADLDGDSLHEGFGESGLDGVGGNEVTQWVDKSGQSNTVSAPAIPNRPTFIQTGHNNLPVLDFGLQENDYLAAPDNDQITENGSYTKVVVFSYENGELSTNNIISSETGGTLFYGGSLVTERAGELFVRNDNPGNNFLENGEKLILDEYYIAVTTYDNVAGDQNLSILNINGDLVSSDNLEHPHLASRTTIGAHNSGAGSLDGTIAEAMIFDRALDSREIGTLECYLSEKWNIAVTTNCNKVFVSTNKLFIDENGGAGTFDVRLNESISSDVTVNLTINNTAEATLSTNQLTFNPTGGANPWDVVQTVTVTAVDDNNTSGDETDIVISVDISSDASYTAEPDQTIEVTLIDDEVINNSPYDFGELVLWMDASNTSGLYSDSDCQTPSSDGSVVNCVEDLSGAGNDLISEVGPTQSDNERDGKTVLEFDNSPGAVSDLATNYLATENKGQIDPNGNYTKFVVYKIDDQTARNNLVSSRGRGTLMWTNGTKNLYGYHRNVDPEDPTVEQPGFISANNLDFLDYHIATIRYDNTDGDGVPTVINIDGVEEDSDDGIHNHDFADIQIGANAGRAGLNGKVAEVLVYNRGLSDAQVDCIEGYLGNKWDIITNNLNELCTPEDSITLNKTKYPENIVFQRDENDQYDFEIEGRYSGLCSSFEASFAGGAFETIDANPNNNLFSGVLENQGIGQGNLIVRCSDNANIAETIPNIGVGDVFIVAGQSNAEGRGENEQQFRTVAPTARYFPTVYTERNFYIDSDEWKVANDRTDPHTEAAGGGSVWPIVGGYIVENADVPVMFITTAEGDKGLVNPPEWKKGVNINPDTGEPYLCRQGVSCYDNMIDQYQESGVNSVKAVLWFQGEKDSSNNTTRQEYEDGLSELITNIRDDVDGDPDLISGVLGPWKISPDKVSRIRNGTMDAWENDPRILYGPQAYDIHIINDGIGDDLHYITDDEIQTLGYRWWKAIESHYYGGSEGRGPVVKFAQYNSDKTEIYLTFETSSPLSSTGDLDPTAWFVSDDGDDIDIDSLEIIDDNTVKINLNETPVSPDVTVSYAIENSGENKHTLFDSTTGNIGEGPSALPADPFSDFPVSGFSVNNPLGVEINEDGETGEFEVQLNSIPTSDVVIEIFSSDDDKLMVSPSTLTFDSSNWDTPQTVVATAVYDGDDDDEIITITFAVNDGLSDDDFDGIVHTRNVLISDIDAIDTDQDGVSDGQEKVASENGDANGDSIPDFQQSNVGSFFNPESNEYMTLEVEGDCNVINSVQVLSEESIQTDSDFIYPLGLIDFDLDCSVVGGFAQVSIYLDTVYDTSEWSYRKYLDNTYIDMTDRVTYTQETVNGIARTVINYTIVDGGPLDADGEANGQIIDPSGPAVPDTMISNLIRTGGDLFNNFNAQVMIISGVLLFGYSMVRFMRTNMKRIVI